MSNQKSTDEKKATSGNPPSSKDNSTTSSTWEQGCGTLLDITQDQLRKITEHKAHLTDICLSEDIDFEKKTPGTYRFHIKIP
jgi:hypothetical protein